MIAKKFAGIAISLAVASGFAYAEDGVVEPETGDDKPDEVVLTDGSRVFGTVKEARDDAITLETEFAGTLTIPFEKIESLNSRHPTVMLMDDETVIVDEQLIVENGQIVTDALGPDPDLEAIAILNPEPWELGNGYKWTGLVNFALEIERGNSDSDELDYAVNSLWQSTRDRYTFDLRGEIDETNGDKTTDDWRAIGQYDYFLENDYFTGMRFWAEEDKFSDIDLRYLVGPHFGRDFFKEDIFKLQAQIGAAYVNENFIVASDQEYGALTWGFKMSSNYLGGDSRLYLNQDSVWNMDETSDVIINTLAGLAFPLLWNFEAAVEAFWEYDSGATDDIDEMDETYRIRLGYTW